MRRAHDNEKGVTLAPKLYKFWQYARNTENFNTFFGSPCNYTCISPKTERSSSVLRRYVCVIGFSFFSNSFQIAIFFHIGHCGEDVHFVLFSLDRVVVRMITCPTLAKRGIPFVLYHFV